MKKDKARSRILIIEDDALLATNIQEMLEDLGYGVVGIAGTLQQARKLFVKQEVNLLLVDIYLENTSKAMDGIELVTRLMEDRKVPIIFLTASADEESRERARFLYPSAYLLKPIEERQLDVSVDFALFNAEEKKAWIEASRAPGDWRFYVKAGHGIHRGVWASDVCYVKADGSDCFLYTKKRRYHVGTSMGSLLEQIGPAFLRRVHRSYSVSPGNVHSYGNGVVYVQRDSSLEEIPFTDTYKQDIYSFLPKLQLE